MKLEQPTRATFTAADFRNSPGAIIEIPQLIDPVSCVI
jgi:hypothetical protein